ncbi:unnamed protein product [Adineta ricciae]|uniref:Uncharacterized protein n=1 Tax=Adineta ricciae TaxID=249248 RepID=A0A814F1T7_ADIRI|nr:unnamed protein product [Adineta ricciae]CAF1125433.1 unnamed protein product [Adineta ricciae]
MLPSKVEHVGHLYSVQSHMVIEGFLWLMYNAKRNQERYVQAMNEILGDTNINPIKFLVNNMSTPSYLAQGETVFRLGELFELIICKFFRAISIAAECIRLLLIDSSNMKDTRAVENHLARMIEIATIMTPTSNSTAVEALSLRFKEPF